MSNLEFLQLLHEQRERTTYVRLTALDREDRPIEAIEGLATSGSINIDGKSAMQRTCNLTLAAKEININDYYWTFNQKFRVEIGLENKIDKTHDSVIWFKQGIFYITTFNCALSVNSYNISISGKDKLCRLDGSMGGLFSAPTDLGSIEEENKNGDIEIKSLPIDQIIREMVHTYGDEPFHNIIINDLEEAGLILQEYRYDQDLFLIREANSDDYSQGDIGGNVLAIVNGEEKTLKEWSKTDTFVFDDLSDLTDVNATRFTIIKSDETEVECCAARIIYGQTAGFKETPLTYAGKLIANAGESVTSILDKIVQMHGDLEYIYNLDGQFIFQKKKTYVNTIWTPEQKNNEGESFIDPYATPFAYTFGDFSQVTSFSNSPAIGEVKNDFSVWGERQGVGGGNIPIHMRYAIDIKPGIYKSIEVSEDELKAYNEKYGLNTGPQESTLYVASDKYTKHENTLVFEQKSFAFYDEETGTVHFNILQVVKDDAGHLIVDTKTVGYSYDDTMILCDWRELIYQMALDYNKYGHLDNFEQKVAAANPQLYPSGRTGYEQYYTDMQGFWRQLYNPQPYSKKDITDETAYKQYEELYIKHLDGTYSKSEKYSEDVTYYIRDNSFYQEEHARFPWSSTIYDTPEQLNFWIDFLDTQGELHKFSVKAIGQRPKIANEAKSVKAIYYKETPNLIFVNDTSAKTYKKTGYRYFTQGQYFNMFATSAQGVSAKEKIDTLLYNHAVTPESVSMTIIPIYNLEPSTRIYISDINSKVSGEYIISKISMPLQYNGTMNISATKCSFNIFNNVGDISKPDDIVGAALSTSDGYILKDSNNLVLVVQGG